MVGILTRNAFCDIITSKEYYMPAYLKGKKLVNRSANLYRESKNKESIVQYNGKPTHVTLLYNRLTDKERYGLKDKVFSIKDYRFAISPNLTIHNLSKLGFEQEFNFVFDEDDLQTMLTTPKVIVSESSFITRDIQDNDYLIHRFYLIAPQLKSNELPIIYRMAIQRCEKRNTYSVSLQAVVGGCRDGSVNLMRVDSPHIVIGQMQDYFIDKPHIHLARPNYVNKRFETLPKDFEQANGVENVEDALQLLMDKCAINRYAVYVNEDNIQKLADIYSKDTAQIVAKQTTANGIMQRIGHEVPQEVELREFVRNTREIEVADLDLM